MNNAIVVTQPDDVSIDGYRILLAGLNSSQNKVVSESLLNSEYKGTVILYQWNTGSPEWFIDKKHKSDLIIFNAEHDNLEVVGYLSAHKNAHYFGNLKFVADANRRIIYSIDDLTELFNLIFNQHN